MSEADVSGGRGLGGPEPCKDLAGVTGAKTVIAINKDPEAPIFKRANLGIVVDYKTVLPALAAELKWALGR